jgi:hypothetical protein
VIGEDPYAEGDGDRSGDIGLRNQDQTTLNVFILLFLNTCNVCMLFIII